MTKELEKLYYLLTEAITNADGTNKPKNEHVSICYTDLQTHITEQEKKEKLLGLYRENFNFLYNQIHMGMLLDYDKYMNNFEKIKALEGELK